LKQSSGAKDLSDQRTIQKDAINQQIQKIREQVNTANNQIQKCVEQRNQLNNLVGQTRQEIAELKKERDDINERVKLLKQQRDEIRAKSAPISDEIERIRGKVSELKKKVPRESKQNLQEELDGIEWRIQTTSLDLQEEKRLIEDVKELELLLSGYKKIDRQNEKMKNFITQRKSIQAQADVFHKELTDLAKKSQEIHLKMVEKLNTLKVSRAQADGLHQTYLKTKEEILEMYVKIAELTGQLNGLRASMREEARARKLASEQTFKEKQQVIKQKQEELKQKEQAIKEKLGAEAKSKLQRGEKLSWNEFQLVMGDASENDSETQD
jgi:uncharacterized coiled-coil DUF342 family protein